MTPIAILNRRLATSLGLVLGGSQGKYEWRETTECFYYLRPPTSQTMEKICWAERLGRGYVLCVWRLPEAYMPDACWNCNGRGKLGDKIPCAQCGGHGYFAGGGRVKTITEQQWKEMFHGTVPYPGRGEYKALPETFARAVTEDLNQNYIWAIDKQVQETFEEQLDRINLEHAMDREQWRERFEDATFDAMPAFMSSESEYQG